MREANPTRFVCRIRFGWAPLGETCEIAVVGVSCGLVIGRDYNGRGKRWNYLLRQRLFERMLAALSYLFSMNTDAQALRDTALELPCFGEPIKFQ